MFNLTKHIEYRNSNDEVVITEIEPTVHPNAIEPRYARAEAICMIALGHILIEESRVGLAMANVRSVECSLIAKEPF